MNALRKRKLSEDILETIREMIRSGQLKEGEKLPNQNEFAAQLGVSRPSLREALHTLTLLGAVEQRPGLGTVIKSAWSAIYTDQMLPPLMSDRNATEELLDCRLLIESAIVEIVVEKAGDEEIEALGKLISDMQAMYDKDRLEDFGYLDMRFHIRLAEATHNRYLVHIFSNIRNLMEQFIREKVRIMPDRTQSSIDEHWKIFRNIEARNAEAAADAMKFHIHEIRRSLFSYYEAFDHPESGDEAS